LAVSQTDPMLEKISFTAATMMIECNLPSVAQSFGPWHNESHQKAEARCISLTPAPLRSKSDSRPNPPVITMFCLSVFSGF
jgi:hypothetical protein